MATNFDHLIPQGVLFNLKQLESMNIIKISMAKKLMAKNELEIIKIGNKLHVSRDEIIRYLQANIIPAI